MMNRDPVVGLTQRTDITIHSDEDDDESLPVKNQEENDHRLAEAIAASLEKSPIKENDEERIALELAIRNSLEDQHEINRDLSITVESSDSDSNGEFNN
jgi:hypothetical protein